MIDIDPLGDLVLEVNDTTRNSKGKLVRSKTQFFRVRKDVMRTSPHLRGDVNRNEPLLRLEGNPIFTTEILLRGMHGALTPNTLAASIKDIW